MTPQPLKALLLFSFFARAAGHAKMISPEPRQGPIQGPGPKLRPFENAAAVANRIDGGDGCGPSDDGHQNNPGLGKPKVTYKAGDKVKVQWAVTIPHPADRKNTGVRVALSYSDKDSFKDNILAGFVGDKDPPAEVVDSGITQEEEITVTLPKDKTCKACTIQWIWAAEQDGGYYLGCADIAIKAAGSSGGRRRRKGKGGSRRRPGKGGRRRRRKSSGSRRRKKAPPSKSPPSLTEYKCSRCGHVYDKAIDGGGKPFEKMPDSFKCPQCGAPKSAFEPQ